MRLLINTSNIQNKQQLFKYIIGFAVILSVVIGIIVLPLTHSANAADTTSFITTWKTDNPGYSNDTSIYIPTYSGEDYNYSVDWNNDGVYDQTGINGGVNHDFGTPGTYTIRISGEFPRIYFKNSGDPEKIIDIKQWGTGAWTSMEGSFYGARNLTISATDLPNLSNVTSMKEMFANAYNFNSDISNWDVSNITDMSNMFNQAAAFNSDISNWNVSNVTNMSDMFTDAIDFNSDISGWNVSSVTDMSGMFRGSRSFNGDLSAWDVSNVKFMKNMFSRTKLSTQNYDKLLTGWSKLNLQPNVEFGAIGARYSESEAARQSIIDDFAWNIVGDGLLGAASLDGITGVGFQNEGGKQIMNITGVNLVNAYDIEEYHDIMFRSFVVLNGIKLPFCSDGVGLDKAQLIAMGGIYINPDLISDTPTCYYAIDGSFNSLMSSTAVRVWLAPDFDTSAPGTVSVNGNTVYGFNQTEPIVNSSPIADTSSIIKRPTFSGTTTPNSTVTVTVHSDPVICTTISDNTGKWSCMLPSDLPEGSHVVNVVVTNPYNEEITFGPYNVYVEKSDTTDNSTNTIITNDSKPQQAASDYNQPVVNTDTPNASNDIAKSSDKEPSQSDNRSSAKGEPILIDKTAPNDSNNILIWVLAAIGSLGAAFITVLIVRRVILRR